MRADPMQTTILCTQIIPNADPALLTQLNAPQGARSLGILTTDCDDVSYAALDEATKKAAVRVVYAKSMYAGSSNASTALAGEFIGILCAENPEEIKSGLEAAVLRLSAAGTPVLGVCGGYQMLGEQLCDPAGEESGTPCTLRGLGLLPTTTVFGTEKHLTQTAACVTTEPFAGAKLTGYEIHAGRTEVWGSAFCILADGTPEGCVQDSVFGTYLHGLFDTGELTEKLTAFLCKRKGIDPAGAELIPMEQYRQQQFDLLADGVRAALDMPAIYAAMGMQKGDNT